MTTGSYQGQGMLPTIHFEISAMMTFKSFTDTAWLQEDEVLPKSVTKPFSFPRKTSSWTPHKDGHSHLPPKM